MKIVRVTTALPSRRALACALALMLIPLSAFAAEGAEEDPQVTTLKGVVVTGSVDPAEQERARIPGAVTTVDGEALYQRGVNNLADALRYVPGLWVQSASGGDNGYISSRGSNLDATGYDNNGVKLFQDGLPVTAADGNNHNRFVDPLGARSIYVAHGANALSYGASTLGGAMDFISPTARDGDPSQLFLGMGGRGLFTTRLKLGGVDATDRVDGLLMLEHQQQDGDRQHSRQRRTSLQANAGWQARPDLDLRIFLSHINNAQQLPGALTRAQYEADPWKANASALTGDYQLNVTTTRVAGKGQWRIDDARRLEFGLSLETQSLYHPIVDKVMVDFDGPGPLPPTEVFSLLINTRQSTLAGMLRYSIRAGDHDVLAGLNLASTRNEGGNYRNDGGLRNGQTDRIDNRSDSAELFLLDRWSFAPGWTLVYGAQGVLTGRDVRTLKLASGTLRNPKADYDAFNPRVGFIRTFSSGNQAYASLSRMFEAPTTFELQDDVRGGDATLDAMRGTVLELGLRGQTPRTANAANWGWDVSAYAARIRDEILSVDDPLVPGTSLSTNIPRTRHAGVEAQLWASIPLGSGNARIEPLLSASWNAFSFDGDPVYGNNRLPAAPRYALRGEVLYRHANGFFVGPTFDVVGARFADFANTYTVPGYALFGLRVGFSGARWELYAEARNLTNRHYVGMLNVRNHAGAGDAILQPGAPRALTLGLRWMLD